METSTEQAPATTETASNNEQEHNEEGMEETEDYSFDGEDYRHFVPRGRGGFRCVIVSLNTAYVPQISCCEKYKTKSKVRLSPSRYFCLTSYVCLTKTIKLHIATNSLHLKYYGNATIVSTYAPIR